MLLYYIIILFQRVQYRNPYGQKRSFTLRSSEPQLLSFKSRTLQLDSHKSDYIHMRFTPLNNNTLINEVYVMIVEESENKLEEFIRIQLVFTD